MRLRFVLAALALGLVCLTAGTARAVLGGQPDGNGHPYVGLETDGVYACSGTLLSPTVMLTAAHCFNGGTGLLGTDAFTGAPIVRASFDPNLANTPPDQRVWYYGSFYSDPQAAESAGGQPSFDTHDVAVIIFGSPGCRIPSGVTGVGSCGPVPGMTSYGSLPPLGAIDALSRRTQVDIVGFGDHDFARVNGQWQPADPNIRYVGQTTMINRDRFSFEYVKIRGNDAAPCFGDSGGPDLVGSTVLAITSFGKNDRCVGASFSYRVDTPEALGWILRTVARTGASLSH